MAQKVGEESGYPFRDESGPHGDLECRAGKLRKAKLSGQSHYSRYLVPGESSHPNFPCYSSPHLQGATSTQGP